MGYAEFLINALPYISAVAILVLSLTELLSNENTKWKKAKLVGLNVFLAIVAIVAIFYGNSQSEQEKAALTARLDVGIKSIDSLKKEVSELSFQVKAQPLLEKIVSLQSKLEDATKALAPGPKARLVFSLVPYTRPKIGETLQPVKKISAVVGEDRRVRYSIVGQNVTKVYAKNLETIVTICDGCRYYSEIRSFKKVEGAPEGQRNTKGYMGAMLLTDNIDFDIIAPANAGRLETRVEYHCETCAYEEAQQFYIEMKPQASSGM